MLHLIKRGRENLRELTIHHFQVATDSAGVKYVYQCKDMATKNHQDDENRALGRMYQIQSDDCPVRSFELYMSKLNPNSEVLFQVPRRYFKVADDTWYEGKPIGKNNLGDMMPRISKSADLSRRYTNHCLRGTAITVLDTHQFASRHIMSVSGHKSENSLKSYSRHTSEGTKRDMSMTLSKSVGLTAQTEVGVSSSLATPNSDTTNPEQVSDASLPEIAVESSAGDICILECDLADSVLADLPMPLRPAPNQIFTQNMSVHQQNLSTQWEMPAAPIIQNSSVVINYNYYYPS